LVIPTIHGTCFSDLITVIRCIYLFFKVDNWHYVILKNTFVWDVLLRSLEELCRHSGGMYCLHLQDAYFEMEAVCSFRVGKFLPSDKTSHQRRWFLFSRPYNLKSSIIFSLFLCIHGHCPVRNIWFCNRRHDTADNVQQSVCVVAG
jgi:hypothetical protein